MTDGRPLLTKDAWNRTVRTLLVAVIVAAFVDVWPIISDALSGSDPVHWAELGKASLRVGLNSAGAFVLRRVLDPARLVPTPLPPQTQPAPVEPGPAPTPVEVLEERPRNPRRRR